MSDNSKNIKQDLNDIPLNWQVGDVIADLYEVTDILGEGGMGIVYKVHHKEWDVDLAVKSIRPEIISETSLENFIKEAETWINLGLHPNIVSCYYVRQLGNAPRIFSEFVDCGSLKDWIRSGKLYEGSKEEVIKRILDISIQSAWGLQHSHEKDLIHQDVKPANVLISSDGSVKVTDFGIAKARMLSENKFQVTNKPDNSIFVSSTGMTPAYCSPEQYNKMKISRKTDIWSWAVSLLEMFTGGVHWVNGILAGEILENLLNEGTENKNIPSVPEKLAELLRQCFKFNPQDRPNDFDHILNKLIKFYKEYFREDYPIDTPNQAELLADSLNNKAVSMLDIGKDPEAVNCWKQALRIDPQHLASTFNYGYFRWQKAEITDDTLVKQMEAIKFTHQNNPDYWLSLGWIHYERGDLESINLIQDSDYSIKEKGFLKTYNKKVKPIGKEKYKINCNNGIVWNVVLSKDGKYALSNGEGTICLWDMSSKRRIRTFEGNIEGISLLCFSKDNKYAITKDEYNIRLWSVSNGNEVRIFYGNNSKISSICLSSNEKFVLSGSWDKSIRLWDLDTGNEIKRFIGHTDIVTSVCFTPDGKFILSRSNDESIRIWDIDSTKEFKTFYWKNEGIHSLITSPNGKYFLTGYSNDTIKLVDITSGDQIMIFSENNRTVCSFSFSPDGRFILCGGYNFLTLRDVITGKTIRNFDGHYKEVNSISFSGDGNLALTGGFDGTIRLWEIYYPYKSIKNNFPLLNKIINIKDLMIYKERIDNKFVEIKNLIYENNYLLAFNLIEALQNGKDYERNSILLDIKFYCSSILKLQRLNIKNAWEKNVLLENSNSINTVCFSPDGRYALSGGSDESIRQWNIKSGREIMSIEDTRENIESVSFSPDGKFIISGGSSYKKNFLVHSWDVEKRIRIKTFDLFLDTVCSVCFSPDGKYILTGGQSEDKSLILCLLDTESGKIIKEYIGNSWQICSACFSSDGLYILSGDDKGILQLWDISSGTILKNFIGHKNLISSICFTQDNNNVISGSYDHTIRLWNIYSGEEVRKFVGHKDSVTSISVSPDGRYLLSGSFDNTIRLWDIQSGKTAKVFKQHTDFVNSVCFSPDGRYALSGSNDGTLRLWEFDWNWKIEINNN